jgi:hypothetical protein
MHRVLNKLEGCVTESDTFPVKGTYARSVCLKIFWLVGLDTRYRILKKIKHNRCLNIYFCVEFPLYCAAVAQPGRANAWSFSHEGYEA